MVHCRPVVDVSRSRPMVGRATVSPLKSMVIRRVVMAMATTTHHLRLRSVTRCILGPPKFPAHWAFYNRPAHRCCPCRVQPERRPAHPRLPAAVLAPCGVLCYMQGVDD